MSLASSPAGRSPLAFLTRLSQDQIVFCFALVLAFVFAVGLRDFATVGNVVALLNAVSITGILALGAAVVIIARGLDISQVGSLVVGAAVAAMMMSNGYPVWQAVVAAFAVTTLVGVVNGFIIAFIEVPPLFGTLATNLVLFGLIRLVSSGSYIMYLPDTVHGFLALGGRIGIVPISLILFAVAAVLVHLFLSYTKVGRFIYAHGDNPVAAREMGIAVRALTIFEYVFSANIACFAGLVLMANLSSIDTQMAGGPMIFDIILVAVLGGVSLVGGRGGVFSVIAGALLVGVLVNGMTLMNLNNDIQNIGRGLVLLGAIVLDNRLHPRDEETVRQGE